jgi:hypothetical protein
MLGKHQRKSIRSRFQAESDNRLCLVIGVAPPCPGLYAVGRTLTKEETISLEAGQTRQVSFDFDAPAVARLTTADVGL